MAKYNANNDMDSLSELTIERARYQLEAWGPTVPEQIVDFNFAERNRYGRINQDRNAIIPRPEFLQTISFSVPDQTTSVMMNFVATAFNEMRDRMTKACRLGIITGDHPFLHSLEISRAYISPIKLYRGYMNYILSRYNNEYLPSIESHTPVINFDDYWKNIINFCKMIGSQNPITFTGWHRSKHSSIFTSGLAIDIAGLPIDDDKPKFDMFISAAEWGYYSNVAKYHGFSISHNAPWLLVADLQSPAMLQYMHAEGLSNENHLFAAQYQLAIDFELELLKNVLIDGYNTYVAARPYYKKPFICPEYNLVNKIKFRESTSAQAVAARIPNLIFYVFYTQIRNIEEDLPLAPADLARVISKLKYFYNSLGPEEAMRYLNEQYRSLYKFKPGTTYQHAKRTKLRKEIIEAENAAEERASPLSVLLPDPTKGSY